MSPGYNSPPDPMDFKIKVWEIVRTIPAGKVATYGQIARLVGPPKGVEVKTYLAFGARWVGGAMAACPDDIPWQRVVNAQGKISLRPGVGEMIQRQILESEGVLFDQKERINLKIFGWEGPA